MMFRKFAIPAIALIATASPALATVFDISASTGPFTPTFRGGPNSTYVGWDVFGPPGGAPTVINLSAGDLGTDGGTFVTNNGEDHLSGSGNYYSAGGSVDETITFTDPAPVTAGSDDGYTTVIVQARTLFGGWPADPALTFSDIDGFSASLVQGNAPGAAQFFAKYEIEGSLTDAEFTITGGGNTSFAVFTVDAYWSDTAFAADTAVIPEPASLILVATGGVFAFARRRRDNA
ncbi:MAG: PEP-CTERM sorting domain-containing protein [Planctomycetota bacterium]